MTQQPGDLWGNIEVSASESRLRGLVVARSPAIQANVDVSGLRSALLTLRPDVVKIRVAYAAPDLFDRCRELGVPFGVHVVNYRATASLTERPAGRDYAHLRFVPFRSAPERAIRELVRATWRTSTFARFANPVPGFAVDADLDQEIAEAYAMDHRQPVGGRFGYVLQDPDGEYVGITYGMIRDGNLEQEYVGVLPRYRGRHYGAALYELLDRELLRQGVTRKFGDLAIDNLPSLNALFSAAADAELQYPYVHVHFFPALSTAVRTVVEGDCRGRLSLENLLAVLGEAEPDIAVAEAQGRWWLPSGERDVRIAWKLAGENAGRQLFAAELRDASARTCGWVYASAQPQGDSRA